MFRFDALDHRNGRKMGCLRFLRPGSTIVLMDQSLHSLDDTIMESASVQQIVDVASSCITSGAVDLAMFFAKKNNNNKCRHAVSSSNEVELRNWSCLLFGNRSSPSRSCERLEERRRARSSLRFPKRWLLNHVHGGIPFPPTKSMHHIDAPGDLHIAWVSSQAPRPAGSRSSFRTSSGCVPSAGAAVGRAEAAAPVAEVRVFLGGGVGLHGCVLDVFW